MTGYENEEIKVAEDPLGISTSTGLKYSMEGYDEFDC
jgi:hypothetical protein